jgi:hypothetical protein
VFSWAQSVLVYDERRDLVVGRVSAQAPLPRAVPDAGGGFGRVLPPRGLPLARPEAIARFHASGEAFLVTVGTVLHICSPRFGIDGVVVARRVDVGYEIRGVVATDEGIVLALATSTSTIERFGGGGGIFFPVFFFFFFFFPDMF